MCVGAYQLPFEYRGRNEGHQAVEHRGQVGAGIDKRGVRRPRLSHGT